MNSKDTVVSNAFVAADTNLQNQINNSTNRIQNIEANTQSWNNVATSIKFYANMGSVTQTFADTTAQRVQYTNAVLNVGGVYSNQVFRWRPGVSNVMVRIFGNLGVNMANNSLVYIYIYKNGSQKCTVLSKRTTNASEELLNSYTFTDITTNAADYYEVWASVAGGGAQINGNNDNWWSGQVVY
jgi:preprotein translocase subunit SecG